MAKVKIQLPEKFIFSTNIPVRITDINYGGHLGNDTMLSIIHEARIHFLKKYGFSELNAGGGAGIIMTDATVTFLSEVFYGASLTVNIAITDPGNLGCDIVYQLINTETGKEAARAKTGIVFFDYEQRRPLKVPDEFKKALGMTDWQ